jgi:cyclic pyranopterin monophosphate synthase
MADFTHIDSKGNAKMIDVSKKEQVLRTALAQGYIKLNAEIISKIKGLLIEKGDVISTARIAGISAAKRTWELIPLCHNINLTGIKIDFEIIESKERIIATAEVKGYDRTGVEMEAMTAVSISLLTIYDMCKALSHSMTIGNIGLLSKAGGKKDYKQNG